MKLDPEAFQAARLARGDTQESLAERADVSRATVQDIERPDSRHPRKTIVTIRKLADALSCSVADIAVGETDVERAALHREKGRTDVSA